MPGDSLRRSTVKMQQQTENHTFYNYKAQLLTLIIRNHTISGSGPRDSQPGTGRATLGRLTLCLHSPGQERERHKLLGANLSVRVLVFARVVAQCCAGMAARTFLSGPWPPILCRSQQEFEYSRLVGYSRLMHEGWALTIMLA